MSPNFHLKKINKYVQLTPKDNSLGEDIDTYNNLMSLILCLSTMVTYEGYLASSEVYSRLEHCPMNFTSYSFLIGYPCMSFMSDGDGHYKSTLTESSDLLDALGEYFSEKFNIKYINLK